MAVGIRLTWVLSADDGTDVDHYSIRRGTSPGPTVEVGTVAAGVATWDDTNGGAGFAEDGTTYYHVVHAVDAAGNVSPASNEEATTVGTAAVTGTVVLAGAGDTLAASADVAVQGAASLAAGGDSISAAGTVSASGSLALTGSLEAFTGTGSLPVSGQVSVAEKEAGAKNRLSSANDFNAGLWSRLSLTVANVSELSPTGSRDVQKLVEGVGFTNRYILHENLPTSLDEVILVQAYAKFNGRRYLRVQIGGTPFAVQRVNADLVTGTIHSTSTFGNPILESGMDDVGDGWYRIWFTTTAAANSTGGRVQIFPMADPSTITYTGDGTSGMFLWGVSFGPRGAMATGDVFVTGAASLTGSTDTLAAAGSVVQPAGTISLSDGQDTLAAAGAVANGGSVALTDQPDGVTGTITGTTTVSGGATLADAADTFSASGTAEQPAGAISLLDGYETLAASGTVANGGSVSLADDADSLAGVVRVPVTASSDLVSAGGSLDASGTVALSGSATLSGSADTLSITVEQRTLGQAHLTDAADAFSAAGTVSTSGAVSLTGTASSLAATGAVSTTGTVQANDGPESFSGAGTVGVSGSATLTERGNILFSSGQQRAYGTADLVDGRDSFGQAYQNLLVPSERVISDFNYIKSGDLAAGGPAFGFERAITMGAGAFLYERHYPEAGTYNFSFYAWRSDLMPLNANGSTVDPQVDIIVNAWDVAVLSRTVEHVGGGLYRLSVTFDHAVSGASARLLIQKYANNSTNPVNITGVQLTPGAAPLPYVKTVDQPVTAYAPMLGRVTVGGGASLSSIGYTLSSEGTVEITGTLTLLDTHRFASVGRVKMGRPTLVLEAAPLVGTELGVRPLTNINLSVS